MRINHSGFVLVVDAGEEDEPFTFCSFGPRVGLCVPSLIYLADKALGIVLSSLDLVPRVRVAVIRNFQSNSCVVRTLATNNGCFPCDSALLSYLILCSHSPSAGKQLSYKLLT